MDILPSELRPFKSLADVSESRRSRRIALFYMSDFTIQAYAAQRIRQFATSFIRRMGITSGSEAERAQIEAAINASLSDIFQQEAATTSAHTLNTAAPAPLMRLVLRHDCLATGCGVSDCLICQYNPSRLCRANFKNKYLIDDHIKAKCGANLRVEILTQNGNGDAGTVVEKIPAGMQLEVSVVNGEKYRDLCPDNTLLSFSHLRSCIVTHHTKALLRRDGAADEQLLRCFMHPDKGQVSLSDLALTTSSEALLSGKAPTFRLLVSAVGASGEHLSNVAYVVSEPFVVATKRVKHAIKSDIPSIQDSIAKLIHIGKATMDKLIDLKAAAREEGFDLAIPDELNSIDKIGQFQLLIEQAEIYPDVKNKVRHLLKLSPEKWDEVVQHALAAVVPDFRNRVWLSATTGIGLLYACKNGATATDQPIAIVKDEVVTPIHQVDPTIFHHIGPLKQEALASWFTNNHPGWAVYWMPEDDGGEAAAAGAPALAAQRVPSPAPAIAAAPAPGPGSKTKASPFAVNGVMSSISDAFPNWQIPSLTAPTPIQQNGSLGSFGLLIAPSLNLGGNNEAPSNAAANVGQLKSEMLPGMNDAAYANWGSLGGSVILPQNMDWMSSSAILSLIPLGDSQGPLGSLIGSPDAGGPSAGTLTAPGPSLDLTLRPAATGKGSEPAAGSQLQL